MKEGREEGRGEVRNERREEGSTTVSSLQGDGVIPYVHPSLHIHTQLYRPHVEDMDGVDRMDHLQPVRVPIPDGSFTAQNRQGWGCCVVDEV
jgi:hypothetical protein